MSVSSEEVYYCTSSSSSSSSSGSSCSTGSFSSASLDSQASTIVATQPCIKPFGCPNYNYFWIENRSKTNPRLSYYYNFKSHTVTWERPVPKDVPLPYYTSYWNSDPKLPSDDDEDLVVSEEEDALQKRKRIDIKRRNRQLLKEGKLGVTQLIHCKKTMSKKKFRTLWKLLRNPGETEEDVKKRLFEDEEAGLDIKREKMPENAQNGPCDPQIITIKKEPGLSQNDDRNNEEPLRNVRPDMDSDSDPEHVGYIIRQEYLMQYSDSELENDDDREEIPEELEKDCQSESDFEEDESSEEGDDAYQEYMDLGSDAELENAVDFTAENPDQDSAPLIDVSDEGEAIPITNFLTVDLDENSNENPLLELNQSSNFTDPLEEEINWSFDSSRRVDNPLLTINNPELNCPFKAPKLKQISKKHLASRKRRKKNGKKKSKPCTTDAPIIDVKENEPNEDGPIVCDMYGTRTINYNHPPKMKIPKWQDRSRLSASDSSDSEAGEMPGLNPPSANHENSKTDALELKNWFPKAQKRKRMQHRRESESSWCDTDISAYSDADDHVKSLVRMKKEKRSPSPEVNREKSVKQEDANEKVLNGQPDIVANEENCSTPESKPPDTRTSVVKIKANSPVTIDLESDEAMEPEESELQIDFAAIEEEFMKDVEKRRAEWQRAVEAVQNEEIENETAPVNQVSQVSLEALAEVELKKAIESLANEEPAYIIPGFIQDSGDLPPEETPKLEQDPFDIHGTSDMISGWEDMFPDDMLKIPEEPLDFDDTLEVVPDVEVILPEDVLKRLEELPIISETLDRGEENMLPDDMMRLSDAVINNNENADVNPDDEEMIPAEDMFLQVTKESIDISETFGTMPSMEEVLSQNSQEIDEEPRFKDERSNVNNSEPFGDYRSNESVLGASSSSSSCGSSCSCGSSSSSSSDGEGDDSDSEKEETEEKKNEA